MSTTQGKFLPRPTPGSKPFWDGCRDGELLIQHCAACGHYQFYPRILCTNCNSRDLGWARSAGSGKVITYTVVRHPVSPAYADDVPYVIALIRLGEGPVMMSNVVQCEPADVQTGMPVEVVFEAWSDEITMPVFRPADKTG